MLIRRLCVLSALTLALWISLIAAQDEQAVDETQAAEATEAAANDGGADTDADEKAEPVDEPDLAEEESSASQERSAEGEAATTADTADAAPSSEPVAEIETMASVVLPGEFSGDAQAGAGKITTCIACHGQNGNSNAPQWPKISGQHARWLNRQLNLYKSGGRENAVMLGMVAALTPQDMADLAAYYAGQTREAGKADPALVEAGESLWYAGNPDRGTPPCSGCHGPNGLGNPFSGYPRLSGQYAQYTADTLRQFRDGEVWGKGDNANNVMALVAQRLTDAEIEAVSSYLEVLY